MGVLNALGLKIDRAIRYKSILAGTQSPPEAIMYREMRPGTPGSAIRLEINRKYFKGLGRHESDSGRGRISFLSFLGESTQPENIFLFRNPDYGRPVNPIPKRSDRCFISIGNKLGSGIRIDIPEIAGQDLIRIDGHPHRFWIIFVNPDHRNKIKVVLTTTNPKNIDDSAKITITLGDGREIFFSFDTNFDERALPSDSRDTSLADYRSKPLVVIHDDPCYWRP